MEQNVLNWRLLDRLQLSCVFIPPRMKTNQTSESFSNEHFNQHCIYHLCTNKQKKTKRNHWITEYGWLLFQKLTLNWTLSKWEKFFFFFWMSQFKLNTNPYFTYDKCNATKSNAAWLNFISFFIFDLSFKIQASIHSESVLTFFFRSFFRLRNHFNSTCIILSSLTCELYMQ